MPCVNHSNKGTAWKCERCGSEWCDDCIKRIKVKAATACVCPKCGQMCLPCGRTKTDDTEKSDVPSKSLSRIFEAFLAPFRGAGILVLIFGTFLLIGADFLLKFGCIFLIVGVLVYFMVYSYVMQVISSVAAGGNRLPFWSFEDMWSDAVEPGFRFVGIIFAAYFPSLLVFIVCGRSFLAQTPTLLAVLGFIPGIVLALLGTFCLPMMLLIGAVTENIFQAVNPLKVIAAIFRSFLAYMIVFIVFLCSLAAQVLMGFVMNVTASFLAVHKGSVTLVFFMPVIINFISFYFLVVTGYMLGVLYYCEEERLIGN
ncbi:MAG: DUF4013 domain-containing protein [Candidatus Aureabacteria bacterium]|nr:DUF4013 domain-containing protein [Candidatus Auribacterota bacterium]